MLHHLHRRFGSGRGMNPTRIVAGSFAGLILFGALLLTFPIASRSGESVGFFNALFTATSATCVTGLVVVDTWQTWTLFGQVVILGLIQLGGLGVMTFITLASLALGRRIGLSQRLLIVSTLNLSEMDGVVRVVRHALMGTFFLEGVGAVILSLCFIPEFGFWKGLWYGIFHSISAFCNAGFDLLSQETAFCSLANYSSHPVVLLTIMALIVVGGLGFVVWYDVWRCKNWKGLYPYSKLVLSMTGVLIVGGTLFFLLAEGNNPATLGEMPWWEKGLNALFQSVTLRTAGFSVINQGGLKDSSLAFSILLMLVGGSSGSTAGGMKTVTVAVLFFSLRAGLRGREEVTLRGRSISHSRVMDALTLFLAVNVLFLSGSMALSLIDGQPYLQSAFEVASAMGTVGLSTGLTPGLSFMSRCLLILLMYLGRVGLLSFVIAVMDRGQKCHPVKYPTINVMIG